MLTIDRWMSNQPVKRMIYNDVYGDLISETKNLKVLDVGGGVSTLTKVIGANTQYTLNDIMVHGGEEYINTLIEDYKINLEQKDWYELEILDDYDIIIANDIFPNVDQRMDMFISKMIPHCKELRLVITYYNTEKYYITKRINSEEVLTLLAYDGDIVSHKLVKYIDRMIDTDFSELNRMKTQNDESLYDNGRYVAYLRFKGANYSE